MSFSKLRGNIYRKKITEYVQRSLEHKNERKEKKTKLTIMNAYDFDFGNNIISEEEGEEEEEEEEKEEEILRRTMKLTSMFQSISTAKAKEVIGSYLDKFIRNTVIQGIEETRELNEPVPDHMKQNVVGLKLSREMYNLIFKKTTNNYHFQQKYIEVLLGGVTNRRMCVLANIH